MSKAGPHLDPNPFAAPDAALEAPESCRPPWFRPGLAPAAVSLAMAAFCSVVAPVFLLILVRTWRNIFDYGPIPPAHYERRYAPTPSNLTALLMLLTIGAFGALAARAWLRGRWWAALCCTAVWLVALAVLCEVPPFSG